MNKIITLAVVVVFGVITMNGNAYAGHRRHSDLLEGVIIGAGAAILGATIITEINSHPVYDHRPVPYKYRRYDKRHRDHYKEEWQDRDRRHNSGYWSIERVWVEPVYTKRWIPGHYSRRGDWIRGRHEHVIIRDGFWESKRIWVSN